MAPSDLTPAQTKELLRLYTIYKRTVGSYDWPKGMSLRLRSGKRLAWLGLVEQANLYSANRYRAWRITDEGVKVAEAILQQQQQS